MTELPSRANPVASPLVQPCPDCGHPNRGRCDPFFRFVEFACAACNHPWADKLTAEQRWTLLHPDLAPE